MMNALSPCAPPSATRLPRMPLELVTAGESHGPALVAIVTGLPAGLVPRLEAIYRSVQNSTV